MKNHFRTTTILLSAFMLLNCSGDNEQDKEKKEDNSKETVENSEDQITNNEENTDEKIEEQPNVPKLELEDRTYSVKEFNKLYSDNAAGLKDQEIVIEGFYMNYNKQKASGQEEFEYNVTLYKDKSCDRDDDRVFFMMESNNPDQFKGIKQYDKISVKGVISGDEFFDAPKLSDGVVI